MHIKQLIRKYIILIQKVSIVFFSKTKFLSTLYYLFFSREFDREHHAVINGKIAYLDRIKQSESNRYQLTRNTHRIEKGLLMRPRRDVFALGYLEDTIISFKNVWQDDQFSNESEQIRWSRDVLTEYFEVTDRSNSIIDKNRKHFLEIIGDSNSTYLIPYHKKRISKVTYDDLYSLSVQRRSNRWFIQKKVERKKIDQAIQVAIQSPSACNRQPFEYRVIDDEILLKEIANLPGGTAGYAHNIPMMIVVIGNLDAYFSERDRHLIYIDASLANMALMFALETLGLSSCAVNWPDVEIREKKMDQLLNLEKFQRPIMTLAVGYSDPDSLVAYSAKKEMNEIRKYN